MSAPLLYTAELDLADEDIGPFMQWYAYRHAPDVYQVGLLSCTCYRVTGSDMNLFDLYELPDWKLFETERYRVMRDHDPYMGPLMEKRRNKAHTVYDQHALLPAGPPPNLNADWIAVARFAAPPTADAAIMAGVRAAMAGQAGLRQIRYATRGPDHPRNPTFRPRCMVVTEWAQRPVIDLPKSLRAIVPDAPDVDSFVGHRVYPWPDHPV